MNIITRNTTPPNDDPRIEDWDAGIDRWRFHRDAMMTLHRQGSGDCAPSHGGAAFSTEDMNVVECEESWWQACAGLVGLIVFLAGVGVAMALVLDEPAPDPDCRMQFNNAAQYVEHCDFHDGRGYVEVEQ